MDDTMIDGAKSLEIRSCLKIGKKYCPVLGGMQNRKKEEMVGSVV